MSQSKLIVPLLIGAVVIGGGSFYGGMRYTQSQTPTRASAGQGRGGGRGGNFTGAPGQGGFQGRNAGGFSMGEVISKDANSLTLKMNDGGSKIIFFSTSTMIGKMATSTMDEVIPGTNVTVTGTASQDGSIAASAIQLRAPGQAFGRPMPNQMP